MNIILFILIFLFFYKFMPMCIKEGDKYFKEVTPTGLTQLNKATKVPTGQLKGYFKAKGYIKDDFDMFARIQGSPDLYVDKEGHRLLQGPFIGDNLFFTSKSTVIYADIEHMGSHQWYTQDGCYEAYMSRNLRTDKIEPVGNYFRYVPHHCAFCGESLLPYKPKKDVINGGGPVETAVLSDSHERYCPRCNEILMRNTETYYPFFIDTLNHRIITSKEKKAFTKYMEDVSDARFIRKWVKESEDRGDRELFTFNDSLLTKEQLSEYTKNEHVVDMWHRLKVLK